MTIGSVQCHLPFPLAQRRRGSSLWREWDIKHLGMETRNASRSPMARTRRKKDRHLGSGTVTNENVAGSSRKCAVCNQFSMGIPPGALPTSNLGIAGEKHKSTTPAGCRTRLQRARQFYPVRLICYVSKKHFKNKQNNFSFRA